MKLSFSSLGCPDWTFDEILTRGREYGYDGVGFRGLGGEMDLTKVPEFLPERREASRQQLAAAGLFPNMMLTSARLMVEGDAVEENIKLAEGHAAVAADLGSPFIRVFGGPIPSGLSRPAVVRRAAERLRRMGDFAGARGVTVLLETHDDFIEPDMVRRVMEATDHPSVGVLWDVHHPWRIVERSVDEAWNTLRPWIRSGDIKDSVTDFSARRGYRYVKTGEGELPLREALQLLVVAGYDCLLTNEKEKKWHPEIPEPEESFPQFVLAIRKALA